MIHPSTELRFVNADIGHGVVAVDFIPKGTITWVRDILDQVWSPRRVARLPAVYRQVLDQFAYFDRHGNYVLAWDHARLENHSCASSVLLTALDFEIAVRDIGPGEQVTTDYGALHLAHHTFDCRCGAEECRGRLRADDLERHAARWDAAVRAVIPLIRDVAQPLWDLVVQKDLVEKAIRDPMALPSCIENSIRTYGRSRRMGPQ